MEIRLDTHQHFWRYDPDRHAWIDESMAKIRRDFMPADLAPILKKNGMDGCIAVQADQSEQETQFLLDLADQHAFIKGVVGWVDLRSPDVEEQIAHFSRNQKLKGVRHIVQGETDVNFLLRDTFANGIRLLSQFNLTYDILIFPHQLGAALEFVRKFPEQPFVIDHLAKPYIKDGFIDGWALLMRELAAQPNVYCKISGMITEADWSEWTYSDFEPYLDVVFSAFGTDRTMFGSDWPVCLVAGSYEKMIGLVQQYTQGFSPDEKAAFFGKNGASFYGI